jgi:thiamine biosynthesis lipoprotein
MLHLATRTAVLGTVVELRLEGTAGATAVAEQSAWETFERLEQLFSTYRPDSELCRWRRGEVTTCSVELTEVLAAAETWFRASGGAFHPATAALTARWRQAEIDRRTPQRIELDGLRTGLPFNVIDGIVSRTGDCSGVDLNAIAKGYIVDRAAQAAFAQADVDSVLVNAGGDLCHLGAGSMNVGIEDPTLPYDNLPPRWRVSVSNAALATSGSARRGFRVADEWLGHVLDPRTGWPVAHTTSVSVLADTAMDADALATVLGVLPHDEALDFAEREQVACLIVDAEGHYILSPAWPG